MTISEVQNIILNETGIKTSVKKGTGSMRGYHIFTPMFQDGSYPKLPFDWVKEFKNRFPECDRKPTFASTESISIYHGLEVDESVKFKRESKPKPIEQMKVKTWGSKNSQMRLDKTASRYAKRRRGPNGDNTVKYW